MSDQQEFDQGEVERGEAGGAHENMGNVGDFGFQSGTFDCRTSKSTVQRPLSPMPTPPFAGADLVAAGMNVRQDSAGQLPNSSLVDETSLNTEISISAFGNLPEEENQATVTMPVRRSVSDRFAGKDPATTNLNTVNMHAGAALGAAAERQGAIPVVGMPAENRAESVFLNNAGQDRNAVGKMGSEPPIKKRRSGLKVALTFLLLLGAIYLGTAWYVSGKVPANTQVAGVNIAGMSRTEAIATLEREMDKQGDKKLTLQAGDTEVKKEFLPKELGFTLDVPATMDRLLGFSLNPKVIYQRLTGKVPVQEVVEVDTGKFEAALAPLNTQLEGLAKNGSVAFKDGKVQIEKAKSGYSLNMEATRSLVASSWIRAERLVKVPVVKQDPVINESAVTEAEKQANTILSAPVEVQIGDHKTTVDPSALANLITFKVDGSRLNPQMNGLELVKHLQIKFGDAIQGPTDARIEIVNGAVQVVPSKDGMGIEEKSLAPDVLKAALQPGAQRKVNAKQVNTKAKFTTEDANKAGVKEVVSEIDTPLTNDSIRTKNLQRACEILNNKMIKPGETFSLGEALGEVDAAHGFYSSGVVVNGRDSEAMGGGLSQMATTTFNLGFFAGYVDVFHQAHSIRFERYPMGHEATLWYPTLDVKFTNNTPYAGVLHLWIENNRVYGELWSTKYWDVNVEVSPPYAHKPYQVIKQPAGPNCVPDPGGVNGFSVNYSRTVSREGKISEKRNYTHTYRPANSYLCVKQPETPAPGTQPAPTPTPGQGNSGH